jgi:Outer membrane protein beta-barrel domain
MLRGQASSENPDKGVRKHFTIGLRIRDLPLKQFSVMGNQTTLTTTTTTTPARDWSFTTTSKSPWWGAGVDLEYAVNPHWTVTAELMMTRLHYTKTTTIAWGTDDPTTTVDERSHMFLDEDTRATLWDVPVLVHYRGLFPSGRLSNMFVSAGAAFRTVTKLKSSTAITYPDTSTGTDLTTAPLSKRTLVGAVAGVGIRVVDDFHIVWTPEIRYTRWDGSTFGTDSTVSPKNQLEVGLGFTF